MTQLLENHHYNYTWLICSEMSISSEGLDFFPLPLPFVVVVTEIDS